MSFCGKCGSQLSENSMFCGKCGTKISSNLYNTSNSVELITGESKNFSFNGLDIPISSRLDEFNSYRLKFQGLALSALNEVRRCYNMQISDLDTFLLNFPNIYYSNLDDLIQTATNILIEENIWTVTFDSFKNQHIEDFHNAMNDYNSICQLVENAIKDQQQSTAKMVSFLPRFGGYGTGLSNALKSAATAYVFNAAKDGLASTLVKNAKIKQGQKVVIYSQLDLNNLMMNVFLDYWQVYLSIVWILNKNGRDIWWPNSNMTQEAKNIFVNMSSPRFPQEKLAETWVQVVKINPYNIDYYKYAINKFGETRELNLIMEYFGYKDLNNPYIV